MDKLSFNISVNNVTDRQLTGLAGEFFVAAELLKRGLQTSITLGTAKQIDLFAYNPRIVQGFQIQVKTLRSKNYFPLDYKKVDYGHVYVFVVLNKSDEEVEYYIVRGSTILENEEGKFDSTKWDVMPGVKPKSLIEYKDQWYDIFGCE